jgi:phosphogluconate dehydratase
LSFGHLPTLMVPAGPMTSGLSNALKSKVRQRYAVGEIGRDELLAAEAAAYHGPGTCTFYGTANSNQMLMELMGLHLPGASFVNPNTPLRTALTEAAGGVRSNWPTTRTPVADIVDEKAVVNGVVCAPGHRRSTNHTMHLVAIARAAGIDLRWDDFADLSAVVPLLARIYPNGKADVNHFHAAGGTAFLVRELLGAGLMHPDVRTVAGPGLGAYTTEPHARRRPLTWRDGPTDSLDPTCLRPVDDPFDKDGGLRMLAGNLGRAVIKTSAVAPEQRLVEAPARVFGDQSEFQAAFEAGELADDLVAVVRYQGPKANGMPELHKLITPLGVLQDRGHRVALVTDGRMSGASGKIPAAIHVTPEAAADASPIARVRDGDWSGSTPTRAPSRCWSTTPSSPPARRPPHRNARSWAPAGSCSSPSATPSARPTRAPASSETPHEFVLDVRPRSPGRRADDETQAVPLARALAAAGCRSSS